MQTLPCSTCEKQVILTEVKYYTADKQHVFCDAYCSNAWFVKRDEPKPGDTIKI